MGELDNIKEFVLAREREAELAYLRYLIECKGAQLEQVRAEQGIVVPLFSNADESQARAEKAEKKVKSPALMHEKALEGAEQRTAVRKANAKSKQDEPLDDCIQQSGCTSVFRAQISGRCF